MISVTDLRAGTVFSDKEEYFQVLSYEHIKMGRGSGTVKVKVRNLDSRATFEKSFITGAKVQEAQLSRKKAQFLYTDSQSCHLMDTVNFDQFVVEPKVIQDISKFLKEGMEVILLSVEGRPISLELPKILEYKVNQTGGSARGNTVGASYKDAILENGLNVKVPLFIKTATIST